MKEFNPNEFFPRVYSGKRNLVLANRKARTD